MKKKILAGLLSAMMVVSIKQLVEAQEQGANNYRLQE